jgi:hypothetical protein
VPPFAIFLLLAAAAAGVQWPFPVSDGTTWQYTSTREPEGDRTTLTRKVFASRQSRKGEVRLEQTMGDKVQWTQLLKNKDGAVLATSEQTAGSKTMPLAPPATLLPAKLEAGTSWNFRGHIVAMNLTLPLKVIGAEEIEVPAGRFRAWHIRGEQKGTVATTAEQWFAAGVGWIKESVTQRSPTAGLIARQSIELTSLPAMHPVAAIATEPKNFEATLSTSTAGVPMDIISADALQIVARWRARPAGGNAKVRAVWIAEDTGGIAPPGYKIDEATAFATLPESVGAFTLSRPPDGWAAGKYRVDFYLQNALVASARVRIAQRAAPADSYEDF